MKITQIICQFIVFSVFNISFESSYSTQNATTNDYKSLTVTYSGDNFKIGNNIASIDKTGQIKSEKASSIVPVHTVTFTDQKIYIIEFFYNPAPTNNLLIYNR